MYKRLKSLYTKKYIGALLKQNGGRCFGEGSFGKVCSPYETFNDKRFFQEMPVVSYFIYDPLNNIEQEVTMRIVDFVMLYNDVLVFKEMSSTNSEDKELDINNELSNMKVVSNIDNTILHKDADGNLFLYLKHGSNRYPLYKRMKGDMLTFIDYEQKQVTKQILEDAKWSVEIFLENLHQKGWYHNDIKLENIMYSVNKDGEYEFAVGDYGLLSKGQPQLGTIKTPWRWMDANKEWNIYITYYSSKFQNFNEKQFKGLYNKWKPFQTGTNGDV
jgi:serine/threonine protein kinase